VVPLRGNTGSDKGNIVQIHSTGGSTSEIVRYDTTAVDADGNQFTKVSTYTVDTGDTSTHASNSVAFDSANGDFYFQKQGRGDGENIGDIFKYNIASDSTALFADISQPGINNSTININVNDMEFANGAIWLLEDNNGQAARENNGDSTGIFKINMDGTLAGFDKFDADGSGFDMDDARIGGFDFDETTGKFVLEAELDWGRSERWVLSSRN